MKHLITFDFNLKASLSFITDHIQRLLIGYGYNNILGDATPINLSRRYLIVDTTSKIFDAINIVNASTLRIDGKRITLPLDYLEFEALITGVTKTYSMSGYEVHIKDNHAVKFGCTLIRPTVFKKLIDAYEGKSSVDNAICIKASNPEDMELFIKSATRQWETSVSCKVMATMYFYTVDNNVVLIVADKEKLKITKTLNINTQWKEALNCVGKLSPPKWIKPTDIKLNANIIEFVGPRRVRINGHELDPSKIDKLISDWKEQTNTK